MLLPWLDLPGAHAALAVWSDAASLDLLHLGTAADADDIRDTPVAQPLLTAAGLLSAKALTTTPDLVCGPSIGDLGPLALPGVATPGTGDALAAQAGRPR